MEPLITIILPVRNEAHYIERALTAVLKQDYDLNRIEIIISDGMSDDQTREIITKIIDKNKKIQIKIIDNPNQIVPTGLNLAIGQARGDIIIRVDGHCEIPPDYVQNCVRILGNEDVDGVGGPVETIGESLTANAIAIAMSSPFGVGGSAFRTVKDRAMLVDSVPFPAYKRETIEQVGDFDEELVRNQDDEFNYRIRKLGGKILLSPELRSKYYSRASLGKLWKQYFQYGYWKVRVLQKHPGQMKIRQFVPPVFTAALLGSALIALFVPVGRNLFGLIIGSYLLTNVFASIWTASRRGWHYLSLLPVVYGILHLSYGFGFLVGLIKFANRWGDKGSKISD